MHVKFANSCSKKLNIFPAFAEKLDGSDDSVQNHTASEDIIIVNHKDIAVSNDEEKLAVNETAIPQGPVEPNHTTQAVGEASLNGDANGPKKSYASLVSFTCIYLLFKLDPCSGGLC